VGWTCPPQSTPWRRPWILAFSADKSCFASGRFRGGPRRLALGRRTDAATVLSDIASCKQVTATHPALSLSSNTSCKYDTNSRHTYIHTVASSQGGGKWEQLSPPTGTRPGRWIHENPMRKNGVGWGCRGVTLGVNGNGNSCVLHAVGI